MATLAPFCNSWLIGAKCKIMWRDAEGSGRCPLIFFKRPGNFILKDEKLLLRHTVQRPLGNTKVLRQYLPRRVRHPVAQKHSLIFREVAVIEDQQELGAIRV